MKKTIRLKKILTDPNLDFICEAHNGISAKIVQECGFKGIWASSFTISASMGVRDNNEASWTQVLEIVEFMSDVTTIPILLDGDTGYGDFNTMRRLVRKLEQRGIAGVCIEDKTFPKTNSLLNSKTQSLANIEEFCGKIKAGKDTQLDRDFCIVARVESFVEGWGLKEALKRAEAYRRAGADAILIHSRKIKPHDIEAFMKEWGNRHPIIIIPTMYYSTPTERFRELGINTVIWANQLMRSAVKAMQNTARILKESESLVPIEDTVSPIPEIFRLQGADELQVAERLYLPTKGKNYNAIILAASRGSELGVLTENKPKAMIKVSGEPILYSLITELNNQGIKNITVVRGYKKEKIQGTNFNVVDNDEFDKTGELYSLYKAKNFINGNCVISYGDCIYKSHILKDLIDNKSNITIVVDSDPRRKTNPIDCVKCSKPYSNDFFNKEIFVKDIFFDTPKSNVDGEWTGLIALNEPGSRIVKDIINSLTKRPNFKRLSLTDMLKALIAKTRISVVYTKGGWLNMNDLTDLAESGEF